MENQSDEKRQPFDDYFNDFFSILVSSSLSLSCSLMAKSRSANRKKNCELYHPELLSSSFLIVFKIFRFKKDRI